MGAHPDTAAAKRTESPTASADRSPTEPDAAAVHAETVGWGRLILYPTTAQQRRRVARLGRHGFAELRHLAGTHDLIATHIDQQQP
jgi:hypothetical protein